MRCLVSACRKRLIGSWARAPVAATKSRRVIIASPRLERRQHATIGHETSCESRRVLAVAKAISRTQIHSLKYGCLCSLVWRGAEQSLVGREHGSGDGWFCSDDFGNTR